MATTEMLCPGDPATLDGVDFLLAGEMSQVATYEECQNRQDPYKPVFLSPMVIYSWADTIDALVKIGVASEDESGAYHVDMLELLELMESDTTWEDLGLAGRPSQIFVHVTDPEKSSSGGTFSGLLANTMNCVEVVDSKTVEPVLPRIFTYYQGVGYLEPSSEALFRSYLTQGSGASIGRPPGIAAFRLSLRESGRCGRGGSNGSHALSHTNRLDIPSVHRAHRARGTADGSHARS